MGSVGSVAQVSRSLVVLEGVRCLDCGVTYSKPAFGGTVEKNPGCPGCGYVGWIPIRPGTPLGRSGIGVVRSRPTALKLSN
jgi:hypothetical protein